MVDVMDPSTRGAHDAYHRLVRAGSSSLTACFFALAKLVVALVPDPSRVTLYLDDTLFHRNGPKVEGAGSWRDALRSTRKRVGVPRGLNLVGLTVGLQLRLPGMTISIPVNLRLHRKDGPTMLALAAEMIYDASAWSCARCRAYLLRRGPAGASCRTTGCDEGSLAFRRHAPVASWPGTPRIRIISSF